MECKFSSDGFRAFSRMYASPDIVSCWPIVSWLGIRSGLATGIHQQHWHLGDWSNWPVTSLGYLHFEKDTPSSQGSFPSHNFSSKPSRPGPSGRLRQDDDHFHGVRCIHSVCKFSPHNFSSPPPAKKILHHPTHYLKQTQNTAQLQA